MKMIVLMTWKLSLTSRADIRFTIIRWTDSGERFKLLPLSFFYLTRDNIDHET